MFGRWHSGWHGRKEEQGKNRQLKQVVRDLRGTPFEAVGIIVVGYAFLFEKIRNL